MNTDTVVNDVRSVLDDALASYQMGIVEEDRFSQQAEITQDYLTSGRLGMVSTGLSGLVEEAASKSGYAVEGAELARRKLMVDDTNRTLNTYFDDLAGYLNTISDSAPVLVSKLLLEAKGRPETSEYVTKKTTELVEYMQELKENITGNGTANGPQIARDASYISKEISNLVSHIEDEYDPKDDSGLGRLKNGLTHKWNLLMEEVSPMLSEAYKAENPNSFTANYTSHGVRTMMISDGGRMQNTG